MKDFVIVLLIAICLVFAFLSARKHFKGKDGCCGGGGAYISKKKLSNVAEKRTVIVDGMTCENCAARVTRAINDMDGLAAKVNLRKKEVVVSMEKPVSNDVIRSAIEKAGYTVREIRS